MILSEFRHRARQGNLSQMLALVIIPEISHHFGISLLWNVCEILA